MVREKLEKDGLSSDVQDEWCDSLFERFDAGGVGRIGDSEYKALVDAMHDVHWESFLPEGVPSARDASEQEETLAQQVAQAKAEHREADLQAAVAYRNKQAKLDAIGFIYSPAPPHPEEDGPVAVASAEAHGATAGESEESIDEADAEKLLIARVDEAKRVAAAVARKAEAAQKAAAKLAPSPEEIDLALRRVRSQQENLVGQDGRAPEPELAPLPEKRNYTASSMPVQHMPTTFDNCTCTDGKLELELWDTSGTAKTRPG